MAGSEHIRSGRAAAIVTGLVLLVSTSSCGEFIRTNPHDPLVPVTLTIVGPDSAFSQFDTLRYTVRTDPEYDHEPAEWSGSMQKLDDSGTFSTPASGSGVAAVQIFVRIGSRTASKLIGLRYRPASFKVRNCADQSRVVTLGALQDTAFVCSTTFDRHNGVVASNQGYLGSPIVSRSLDPNVVISGTSEGRIVSVRNGTAAVVFSSAGFSDTMSVVVKQEVAFVTVSPSACSQQYSLLMSVGSTIQLSLMAPAFDRTQHVVSDTTVVQQALSELRWFAPQDASGALSVTTDGQLKASSPGFGAVWAAVPGRVYSGNFAAYCFVQVK